MKLQELAERLQCRIEGGADADIRRVAAIEKAGPGDLTFVANPRYVAQIGRTRASAVIVAETLGRHPRPPAGCALLRARDPYTAFAHAVRVFADASTPATGVDRLSAVAPDAVLGADVSIGPFAAIAAGAFIGARTIVYPTVVVGPGARIGEDCILHSHVAIRERVVVGNRVTIQNGAVIGSDGFGFATQPDGSHLKIPQQADVVIEDDVEIGANTTIDRPAVGETRVRAGAKIDNLVQVGHGSSVGAQALLAAQVGIAGSAAIEDDVVIGGQAGVGGHLRVGKGAIVAGRTVVSKSVRPGEFLTGYPGIPNREWRKASVIFRHLPELKKRIEALEARIAELTASRRRTRRRPRSS